MARFPRLITVFLSVFLATVASWTAAAAQSEGSLEGKEIVFITYGNASEYQIASGEWFKQLAEAEGAKVSVVDGKFDPVTQVKAMDDAVAAGVDAILVSVVDTAAIVNSTQAARDAGIVVGTIAFLPDPAATVPALGIYNDASLAQEAARSAVEWLKANKPGEKAKLVLFDIPAAQVCHDWRMVAFHDEIVKQMGVDNVEVVYFDHVDHTLDKVVAKMQDIVQAGNAFNVFSACGGTGAVGGLDVLTQAGMAKAADGVPQDIWALSIDGTPAELAYLTDPDVSLMATIVRLPRTTAQKHLDLLKRVFAGEIDPDSDFVDVAPGLIFSKSDSCEHIRDTLVDEYSVVPGYAALECS